MTVNEALEMFRSGSLSPVELLEAYIKRAEKFEPKINAFTSQRLGIAREDARRSEEIYLRSPDTARPLEGIPMAYKNEHSLAGDTTTLGCSIFRNVVDKVSSPVAERLLDNGVIIHARSNVPEFSCAPFTRTIEHGVTRNPWNLEISCGGSSGGSAASVAAGMTMLGSGTDSGGSLRIPGSLCGVVAMKASYGRIPENLYWFAMNPINAGGVIGRSVTDCVHMYNAINGVHRDDPATVTPAEVVDVKVDGLRQISIAMSTDLGFFNVAPEIVENTRRAADAFRELGARVDEISLNWTSQVAEASAIGNLFVWGQWIQKMVGDRLDLVNDYTLELIEEANQITPEQYLWHFEFSAEFDSALQKVFDKYDFLICPTMAVDGYPAEGPNQPHQMYEVSAMTYPFNLIGRHPVMTVPSGIASNGVPTGLQIVGRKFQDANVFRAGVNLESVLNWRKNRPLVQ